ncbi:MAG: hypothetical protein WA435_13805 [Gallionellaceae bacterium]
MNISVELTNEEAKALAQYIKYLEHDDYQDKAVCYDESIPVLLALSSVAYSLKEAGFDASK